MNSQVFLQMVFVFKGFAALCAFELAITSTMGQHVGLRKESIEMSLMHNLRDICEWSQLTAEPVK